jgi:hypothetical protein
MLRDPPRAASEIPRVIHLREPRLGVSFDAPDDGWIATALT